MHHCSWLLTANTHTAEQNTQTKNNKNKQPHKPNCSHTTVTYWIITHHMIWIMSNMICSMQHTNKQTNKQQFKANKQLQLSVCLSNQQNKGFVGLCPTKQTHNTHTQTKKLEHNGCVAYCYDDGHCFQMSKWSSVLGTCEVCLYDGFVHCFTLGQLNGEWHGMCGAMCYVIATCSVHQQKIKMLVYDHTEHV